MAKQYHQIVTPVGRIVGGSFDQPRLKDQDNKDYVYNDGTLAAEYSVLLAIPKGQEQHWNQTAWGAQIWNIGDSGYPGGFVNRSDFSWKIQDGDNSIPNKNGKKNCEREGYPGHWVIAASRRCPRDRLAPPQYVDIRTNPARPEAIPADAIKHGYYAQLCIQVSDNTNNGKPALTPGVYVNLEIVALAAFGQPIILGTEIDASQVGFGGFALPAGAMTAPPAGLQAPNAPPAAGAASSIPAATMPPAAPAPVVTPNHAFAAGGAPMAPPPAAAPAPAPARQMTAAATASYEAYIAAGWNDAQLIANGLMVG